MRAQRWLNRAQAGACQEPVSTVTSRTRSEPNGKVQGQHSVTVTSLPHFSWLKLPRSPSLGCSGSASTWYLLGVGTIWLGSTVNWEVFWITVSQVTEKHRHCMCVVYLPSHSNTCASRDVFDLSHDLHTPHCVNSRRAGAARRVSWEVVWRLRPCVTVRPGAKERRDLFSQESLQKVCAESTQDHENILRHPEFSTLSPTPKALAVDCRESPRGVASLFLLPDFICGVSCFRAFVFYLFPVSSLPLNQYPGLCPALHFSFRPVKHISDPADWQYWGSNPGSQSWGSEPICVLIMCQCWLGPTSWG